MNEQANIEMLKKSYDAFQKGDVRGMLAIMDPEIDFRLPEMEGIAFAGARHGIAQVQEFFRQLNELMALRSFTAREFIAQGDRVIVLGYYEWLVRKTGASFGTEWVHAYTIRNGKVTSFEEFGDTARTMEAFGLAGAGAAAVAGRPEAGRPPSVH